MVSTRGVLAILGFVTIAAAMVASSRDRHVEAAWLMTAGFALATLWGVLSVTAAERGQGDVPRNAAVSLTAMAAALGAWYFYKAINREPVT